MKEKKLTQEQEQEISKHEQAEWNNRLFAEVNEDMLRRMAISISVAEKNEINLLAATQAISAYTNSVIEQTTEAIKNKMYSEIEKEREKLVTNQDYFESVKQEIAAQNN